MRFFAQQRITNNATKQSIKSFQLNKFNHDATLQADISDLVVFGTVIDIKETPAPKSEMFHSKIIIHINKILKGKANFNNLVIDQQSGPLSDVKNADIISSIEPRFKIGENVVLFLKKITKNNYTNSNFVKHNFKSFEGKKSLSELPDSVFWIGTNSKFSIKNDTVYYFEKRIKKGNFFYMITGHQ